MPMLKAFHLLFMTVTCKNGLSSIGLANEVCVQQKTAWNFKLKIKHAMIQQFQESYRIDNSRAQREIFRVCCEPIENFESSVVNAPNAVIERPNNPIGHPDLGMNVKELRLALQQDGIPGKGLIHSLSGSSADPASLVQDQADDKLKRDLPRVIGGFTQWLRGVYHRCDKAYLPGYYDEYFYRLGFQENREVIFHDIIKRFVAAKPRTYMELVARERGEGGSPLAERGIG